MRIQSLKLFNPCICTYKAQNKPDNSAFTKNAFENSGIKSLSLENLKANFSNAQCWPIGFLGGGKTVTPSNSDIFENLDFITETQYLSSFKNYIHRKGKIKRETFEAMDKEKQLDYRLLARETYEQLKNQMLSLEPENSIRLSYDLKTYLDEIYKKTGYRIIAVGTSPSTIAQGMEYLGAEVIYLPLTNAREFAIDIGKDKIDSCINSRDCSNINILINYLKSKGIADVNDEKTNIILDFSASGTSLNFAYNLIQEAIGQSKKAKIVKCDMIKTIEKSINKNNPIRKDFGHLSVLSMLSSNSYIQRVSPTPHFKITNKKATINKSTYNEQNCINPADKSQKEIFKDFEDFSTPFSRIYSILLLEEAELLEKYNKHKSPNIRYFFNFLNNK